MKLGIVSDENGRLQVINAETGEKVEGQRVVVAKSGIDRETIVYLEFIAYDGKGKKAIG